MKPSRSKEKHDRRNSAFGVLLIAVTLAAGPTACLSDVVLPDCVAKVFRVSARAVMRAGMRANQPAPRATPGSRATMPAAPEKLPAVAQELPATTERPAAVTLALGAALEKSSSVPPAVVAVARGIALMAAQGAAAVTPAVQGG